MERPAPCFEQCMNATILFFCLQVFCLPSVHLRNQWSNIRNERGERRAWRLESAATIEEVSRKMRDTASETLALPHEEAASSFSSTSMFDVGRSMFDVQIPLFPNN